MFERLEESGSGIDEGRLFEVFDDDELVVLGLCVHAVVGLHVV